MTWGDAFEDAMGEPVATADEISAAWFSLFDDVLNELAMSARSQMEDLARDIQPNA